MMGFCNSCERNKISKYWPCQIPKLEREKYGNCHAEEKGFPQFSYVPIPNTNNEVEKTKKISNKEKREMELLAKEREKAKKNLETACEILGWDNDETLHILQTKQFLKYCRDAEKLGVFDFEHAMTLIAKADRLRPYLAGTIGLVGNYIIALKENRISGLDGERVGTIDSVQYAEKIKQRIIRLVSQRADALGDS
jgi:hypothetical protein